MTKELKYLLLYGIPFMMLCSCTGLRQLPPKKVLYTGSELEFVNDSLVDNTSKLRDDLEQFLVPEPNSKFLWMRPKLSFYLTTKEPKREGKGVRHLLKYVIGRPPVSMDDVSPQQIAKQLQGRLFNLGYFESSVDYEIVTDSLLATVHYRLNLKERYFIERLDYPEPKDPITSVLAKEKKNSLFLPDGGKKQEFTLDLLAEERLRLVNILQNKGFYYVQEDHLLFKADSTIGNHKMRIVLELKKGIPEKATKPYHISKVVVNPSYSFGDSSLAAARCDTVKKMCIYGNDSIFKVKMLSENIYIEKDSLFRRAYRELTLKRLISLGVFEFVNVRYVEDTSDAQGLIGIVELSPTQRRSIQTELKVATKSNGFTGPGLDFSFTDRNLFRGAEYFKLTFDAGYEVQLGAGQQGLNSYLLGLNAEYRMPKSLTTIKVRPKRFNESASQTKYKLGFRSLNRINFYQLNSVDFMAGFIWKTNSKTQHELNAVNLNYLSLPNTSDEFEAKLSENQRLRQSFENQFIFGPSYYITYSNQSQKKSVNTYFKAGVDFSGNLLSAITSMQRGSPANTTDPHTIAGVPYSQYTRFETDLRMYSHLSKKTDLAWRAFAGVGLPYGNSATLPFVKQYFIGGASDNRGFAPRSVGPGSFSPSSVNDSTLNFIDQTGDIKLQTNLEYRFPIIGFFKAALFTDVSNIWLTQTDSLRPGARFNGRNFMDEFAVSAGLGLRFDISLFILRFDIGIPLIDPRLPENERFVTPELSSSTYRKNHLVYAIAIGYPF